MATSFNNGKSLSESINDVLNEKSTRTEKRSKLVKLGLCDHEVIMLLNQVAPIAPRRKGAFDFSKLTFGVEIECYNFTRQSLIEKGSEKGLAVHSEGYNHEDNHHYYKIVSDGSLTGENSNEVVSPILKGNKVKSSLKAICEALAECDARVNRSCGLHVHIGAANISDEHYCRIVRNYQALELVIDSFMALSRRANNNGYSRSLRGIDFSNCTTKREIAEAMNDDRYFKVNATAYYRHHTIEFRQHQGTTDYEKISNWVVFLAKLVEYSEKKEITTCNSIEEIPFLKESEKQFFINRRNALQ